MQKDNVVGLVSSFRTRSILKEQKVDVSKLSVNMLRDINATIAIIQKNGRILRPIQIHAIIAYLQQEWTPEEIQYLLP